MRNLLKRSIAALIAIVMVFAFTACTQKNNTKVKDGQQSDNGTLFKEPTEISIMLMSHPSWPFNENWAMWRYLREATGATFKIQAVPTSEFLTKLNLVMATPNDMPDLITLDYKGDADRFSDSGALVAIDDHLDQMPNYTKFWNSIPEKERGERLIQRKSADGKTYFPQSYGMDSRQGVRSWMYRKDVFDKNNIKVPTTMDEFFDACMKLKKLYPESYPWALRQGLRNIELTGPEWKEFYKYNTYYDFKTKDWHYGVLEDAALEQVKFMLKMYQNSLIPPDYLTITSKPWEELVSTDRGFVLTDFTVRIDTFTNVVKQSNPDFKLEGFIPPVANPQAGVAQLAKNNVDPKGYILPNTKNEKRIGNAIKFIDWLYSDKAADLVSWGKEGETYNVVNGERQYIKDENEDLEAKYGRFNYGTYTRVDPKAAVMGISDTQRKAVDLSLKTISEYYEPSSWIAFPSEVSKDATDLKFQIDNYVDEQLSKFLLGQEPLSNWDNFVKTVRNDNVDQLLKYYADAYNNLTAGK